MSVLDRITRAARSARGRRPWPVLRARNGTEPDKAGPDRMWAILAHVADTLYLSMNFTQEYWLRGKKWIGVARRSHTHSLALCSTNRAKS